MSVVLRLRPRFASAILVAVLVVLPGCARRAPSTPDTPLPPTSPGLELQEEDYAKVKGRFRTNLLKKGPAPQRWQAVRLPKAVREVEYHSGDLKLKGWLHEPANTGARKLPAVLYLHGGWAFDRDDWELARPFREAGFVVLAPLLRGENGMPGNFSMFYDEIDDVLAAAEYLAKLPGVDAGRIFVSGHSAGGTHALLAAMASKRFRAVASISASPDRIDFVQGGWEKVVPFDSSDVREFQVRSPVAFATSLKCPARLFVGSEEDVFHDSTQRTALLAKRKGLNAEAVIIPGDHMSCVPEALRQAISFFRSH